jgi:hypothetical protein
MTSLTHKNRGLRAQRRGKSVEAGLARGQPSRKAPGLVAAGLLGAAVLTGFSAGCQNSSTNDTFSERFPRTAKIVKFLEHNPHVKPDAPTVADGAMLARQWPQSDAEWSNAKLVGWPTRFPFNLDVTADRPFPGSRVEDTVLFLYQCIRLPFTYIKDPPFETVIYTSDVKYHPTFEAMPALPPPHRPSKVETAGEVSNPVTMPGTDVTGGPLAPGDVVGPGTTAPSSGK